MLNQTTKEKYIMKNKIKQYYSIDQPTFICEDELEIY